MSVPDYYVIAGFLGARILDEFYYQPKGYGLHGLRVSGYDLARRHDEELAVAHGGWKSTAHKRYSRFSLAEVRNLSAAIVRMAEVDVELPCLS